MISEVIAIQEHHQGTETVSLEGWLEHMGATWMFYKSLKQRLFQTDVADITENQRRVRLCKNVI